MKYKLPILILFSWLMFAQMMYSQNRDTQGDAAYLFAYYPKEGLQKQFENGYKNHLAWHERKNDPLVWYAWYVQTGAQLGLFIDGTFGLSHQAFDNRIAAAEDYADFLETTVPFVNTAYRKIYTLKKEMSTVQLLETYQPSSAIEVYHIVINPGKEIEFENLFKTLRSTIEQEDKSFSFTCYKLISGGEQSGYLLMAPRNNFAHFDNQSFAFISIHELFEKNWKAEPLENALKVLSASILSINNETWGYRSDLSRIPKE